MMSEEQIERVISALEQINSSTLTIADYLSISAVAVSIVSIIIAVGIFRAQQKSERRRYTAQLHDWYWSDEMRAIREEVFSTRAKWAEADDQDSFIQDLLSSAEKESEWRSVSRLLFFFSDIERHIRNKTVDKELALEMFGDAQYQWFSDFFAATRSTVEQNYAGKTNPPSWIDRTKAFEKLL